jgi:cysteine-rich repeat protein
VIGRRGGKPSPLPLILPMKRFVRVRARDSSATSGLACLLVLAGALSLTTTGCGNGSSSANFGPCGNGQIDAGEGCDDGNLDDSDACTSACQPARCGDGVVHAGVEECDSFDLAGATCAMLGREGGVPACSSQCELDPSPCGERFTPTPEATPTATATITATSTPTLAPDQPTFTPTVTPTATPDPCGDGLLSPDETCDTCPADCTPRACEATEPTVRFSADFSPPQGRTVTAVTILVAYRSDRLSLPGTGSEATVRRRVLPPPPLPQSFNVNDLDYGVRVVMTRTQPLRGVIFTVDFDRCSGAPAPTVADLACIVEGCAESSGPLRGCSCAIEVPAP